MKNLKFHRKERNNHAEYLSDTLTVVVYDDGNIHVSPEFLIDLLEKDGWELQNPPDPEKDKVWLEGYKACREFMTSKRTSIFPPSSPYA